MSTPESLPAATTKSGDVLLSPEDVASECTEAGDDYVLKTAWDIEYRLKRGTLVYPRWPFRCFEGEFRVVDVNRSQIRTYQSVSTRPEDGPRLRFSRDTTCSTNTDTRYYAVDEVIECFQLVAP